MAEEKASSETSAAPAPSSSDLERRIIEQVEYYFGDTNLRKDRFMQRSIAENDGWVDMDTMLKFRRLNQLSQDKAVICAALRKSESGLMEVADDDSKIRRSPSKPVQEMTEDVKKDLNMRTGYAKGFPETATLDDIQSCLARHGFAGDVVRGITMRRHLDSRNFKGSIFLEFATEADCKRFGSADTQIKFADDGEPLICLTREAYYQKKNEERREQRLQAKARASSNADGDDGEQENEEASYESGCILHFDGCGEKTRRETLKELFGRFEDIAWVSFKMDDKQGEIRFANGGGAQRALDKVKEEGGGKVVIDGVEATCHILEGEEEKKYWQQAREEMKQMRARNKAARSRPGGKPGRGRGNKRRGDWGGAPRAKKARSS